MIDCNLSGARDSVLKRRPGPLRTERVTHCASGVPDNIRRFRILISRAVADIHISWLVI
jgi:hypothetical protein